MYAFGSGVLAYTPDTGTPGTFATLQGMTLDIQANLKDLFGEYQYPVAVGRGYSKISIKADAAKINGPMLNDIYFRGTATTVGKTTTIAYTNKLVGTVPYFSLDYTCTTDWGVCQLKFKRVAAGKLGISFKGEDFAIPNFEMSAFADDSGAVFDIIVTEK